MRARYNIVGPENLGIDAQIDPQRTINMYPHIDLVNKKSALLPSPGVRMVVEGDAGPSRAKYANDDKLYSVEGSKVYFYDSALIRTNLATIGTASGYIGISANNNNQVIFVDGVAGYIWDKVATTWATITDPGFPSQPIDVAFLDGYFIVLKGESNEFFVSTLNNGLVYNTLLDFALFDLKPDNLVGVRTLNNRIYLFGTKGTTVWYNAGASDFPLRPIKNEALEFGCATVGSLQKGHGHLVWLARDESGASSVRMMSGGEAEPISTDAIEYKLANLTSPSDADSKLYKENGHIFYELSFTADNITLTCDLSNISWHVKEEMDGMRFRAKDHAFFNNKQYVGSYNDNNLYVFDSKYYLYGEDSIKRIRIGEPIEDPKGALIQLNSFELLIKSGIGESSGDSEDPSVFLSLAYENGVEFVRRVEKKVGKTGERKHRVIWRNLGTGYSIVPKIEYYQKGDFLITGVIIDYDILK